MAGHKIRKTAWGLVIVLVVLICILAYVLAAGIGRKPPKRPLPPPPMPEEPDYVPELVDALNKYYVNYGEYPPYLLGGLAEEFDLADPLIESGILRSYPKVQKSRIGLRFTKPIENVVSSPNDPYVKLLRNKYKDKAIAEAMRLMEGQSETLLRFRWETDDKVSEIERAFNMERFLCGGGVESLLPNGDKGHKQGLEVRGEYVVIPETYQFVDGVGRAIRLTEMNLDLMFFTVGSEFGYQRGEFLSEDKRSCWLWFYADEPQLQNYLGEPDKPSIWVVGLDLVDTDDGLIQPDGIPDGIVLLYKLKEGEVIEVVKKYD